MEFYTKIVGVTFNNTGINTENRQRIIAGLVQKGILKENTELALVREPENQYDPNAVAVFAPDGRQLGYLPSNIAQHVSSNIANGIHYNAYVTKVTGGDADSFYGINLKIVCKMQAVKEEFIEGNKATGYYSCPECSHMISDDDSMCLNCGCDATKIHPWVKSIKPEYFAKATLPICPFRYVLDADSTIPVLTRHEAPVFFLKGDRWDRNKQYVFFLYPMDQEDRDGLYRFSMASKKIVQISDQFQTVQSFDMAGNEGVYVATWEQEEGTYLGIYYFEGLYPCKTVLLNKVEISRTYEGVRFRPIVHFYNGSYYISGLPSSILQAESSTVNCFVKMTLAEGPRSITIEEIPALSGTEIQEMIFIEDTLIYIDISERLVNSEGKGKRGIYSFDFQSEEKNLLVNENLCCNLSSYNGILCYERSTHSYQSALFWNRLDEKKQKIIEQQKCTDFSGAIFDGSYLIVAASSWQGCCYGDGFWDGDSYSYITLFKLHDKKVIKMDDCPADPNGLILCDNYLFVYSDMSRQFGYYNLENVSAYIPIMIDGESILEYWDRLWQEEKDSDIKEWKEKLSCQEKEWQTKQWLQEEARQKTRDELFLAEYRSMLHSLHMVVCNSSGYQYGKGEIVDILRKKSIVLQIKFADGNIRYFGKDALGKTLFIQNDVGNEQLAELIKIIEEFSNNII